MVSDKRYVGIDFFPPIQLEYVLKMNRKYSSVTLPEDEKREERLADLKTILYNKLIRIIEAEDILLPEQREVLILTFFYRLSRREVAAVFTTNHVNIMRRVNSALRKIQKYVSKDMKLFGMIGEIRSLENFIDFYY